MIVCCAGSDSDGGIDEMNEVPESDLSDSSMRQPQSCASSVQVVSNNSINYHSSLVYNHFTDWFLSLLKTRFKLSCCVIPVPVVCSVYGCSVCVAVNGHSACNVLVEFPDITWQIYLAWVEVVLNMLDYISSMLGFKQMHCAKICKLLLLHFTYIYITLFH